MSDADCLGHAEHCDCARYSRLRAINAELVEVLKECADDLAVELEHYYKDTKDYPGEMRKYERDIAPVRKARAVIAKAKGEA